MFGGSRAQQRQTLTAASTSGAAFHPAGYAEQFPARQACRASRLSASETLHREGTAPASERPAPAATLSERRRSTTSESTSRQGVSVGSSASVKALVRSHRSRSRVAPTSS